LESAVRNSDVAAIVKATRLDSRRGSRARTFERTSFVLFFVALTLVVASLLHLAGLVHGRGGEFNADHAGIAEAVIAVVLVATAFTMRLRPEHARAVGLIGVAFGILGFLVGLSFTLTGGDLPDITYHLVVLPLLVVTLIALWRA
jgi:hypothetical protein